MRYAIIADIHANLAAFMAVLVDIKQQTWRPSAKLIPTSSIPTPSPPAIGRPGS